MPSSFSVDWHALWTLSTDLNRMGLTADEQRLQTYVNTEINTMQGGVRGPSEYFAPEHWTGAQRRAVRDALIRMVESAGVERLDPRRFPSTVSVLGLPQAPDGGAAHGGYDQTYGGYGHPAQADEQQSRYPQASPDERGRSASRRGEDRWSERDRSRSRQSDRDGPHRGDDPSHERRHWNFPEIAQAALSTVSGGMNLWAAVEGRPPSRTAQLLEAGSTLSGVAATYREPRDPSPGVARREAAGMAASALGAAGKVLRDDVAKDLAGAAERVASAYRVGGHDAAGATARDMLNAFVESRRAAAHLGSSRRLPEAQDPGARTGGASEHPLDRGRHGRRGELRDRDRRLEESSRSRSRGPSSGQGRGYAR